MLPRFKGRLSAFLVLAGLALASLIALQVVGVRGGGDDPGNLVAPGRTHLSVCVDGAGGINVSPSDVDKVSTALDNALASLAQVPPEFGQPTVTGGCPPPLPLGEPLDYGDRNGGLAQFLADATLASQHLLWVYSVPDELYAASFGSEPFTRATAEIVCRNPPRTPPTPPEPGHPYIGFRDNVCSPTTVSLYLPASIGTGLMEEAVLRALGLFPRKPDPTFDLHACEQGTLVPGCREYLRCTSPLTPTGPYCEDEELWESLGLEPPQ